MENKRPRFYRSLTAEKIRNTMEAKGVRSSELAASSGLTAKTIRRYMKGDVNMTLRSLFRIAFGLGCIIDDILGVTWQ